MNCLFCSNETENPKFCSRSCSASYNNRKYPKRVREHCSCTLCGIPLKNYGHQFCSNRCAGLHRFYTKTVSLIEQGLVDNPQTLRKYLMITRPYTCEVCDGLPLHNGLPLTLEMDHIDGNSDNCLPSNLRWICPNCHSQQPTSRGGIRNKKFTKRNRVMHLRKKT